MMINDNNDDNEHAKEGHHHVDEDDQREQRICNEDFLFIESIIIDINTIIFPHISPFSGGIQQEAIFETYLLDQNLTMICI